MSLEEFEAIPIQDRLRAPAYWMSGSGQGHEGENDLPFKAADEIDRLKSVLDRAREALATIAQGGEPDDPQLTSQSSEGNYDDVFYDGMRQADYNTALVARQALATLSPRFEVASALCRILADTIPSALSAAGYVIVPREPTEAMALAFHTQMTREGFEAEADKMAVNSIRRTLAAAIRAKADE